jgi:hypothetical protein
MLTFWHCTLCKLEVLTDVSEGPHASVLGVDVSGLAKWKLFICRETGVVIDPGNRRIGVSESRGGDDPERANRMHGTRMALRRSPAFLYIW